MIEKDRISDCIPYNSLLVRLCNANNVEAALELHQKLDEKGCILDLDTYDLIVDGLYKAGKSAEVHGLLKKVKLS
ncbi:hypothetical protein O6H91_06G001600 [Diphasiastrum complanatum]|nr:hypothetical protein O6H91_06G001600 [Diphasiastrum complanatum]